ncbi:MAG: hypothetical protein ABI689_09730 [Thermoanaerobaculia bacterium]
MTRQVGYSAVLDAPRAARLLALCIALWVAAAPVAAATPTYGLRFEKLNRTYSDFAGDLAPIGEDSFSVRLRSPRQAIILRDHRIRLTPIAGAAGSFAGELEIDVQGKGDLIADVTIGPMVRNLTDVVVVPPQTIRLAATVRIRRVADGYAVQPEKLPERVEVAVQSQTINQILALCDQAATLSLGAIDCSGLERSLTRPAVPIPGGGGAFLLGDENLTDADRAQLDAIIGVQPGVEP